MTLTTNQKLYVGLGVLVAAVFGGTVLKLSSPPEDPKQVGAGPSGAGGAAQPVGELLRYDIAHIYYNPADEKAVRREYPGYFERGEYLVPFWFCNPNPEPVRMSFQHTSCGACSFAEIAAVPTPKIDAATPEPFVALLGGSCPPLLDVAEHAERQRLVAAVPAGDWQRIRAQNSNNPATAGLKEVVEFPPGTPDQPRWGVIRLNIKVNESKTLEATIGLVKGNMTTPSPVMFRASVMLAEMCEVFPPKVAFGDIPDGSPPVSETVYFYSATRSPIGSGPAYLPPPVAAAAKNDPFLTFSAPQPMTAAECQELAARLSTPPGGKKEGGPPPARVTGGYKLRVTLSRTAPDPQNPGKTREIDIGPSDRQVNIAPAEGAVERVPQVLVSCRTLGPVWADGGAVELDTFQTKAGIEKTVKLVAERAGLELEPANELNDPDYVRILPLPAPQAFGAKITWAMKVKVDPGVGGGRIRPGSTVALRIKSTGQIIRIPVTGNGQS